MGFFDRFKKKETEQKVEPQRKVPLTIKYDDGTIAEVSFGGLQDYDGKVVHRANILYTAKNGSFTSKSVLLEPIPYQDENGKWQDGTEQYYRQLSALADEQTQEAIHLFFDKWDIEQLEKWSSNYLGNIAKKENGNYRFNYDENFKARYSQQFQAEKAQKAYEAQQRHERNETELARRRESIMQQGIQEQLERQTYGYDEDTSGYVGRLTQEDYQKQFGNRETRTSSTRGER